MRISKVLCFCGIVFAWSISLSQDKGFKTVDQDRPDQRVALIIGNAKYASAPLRNPENDANDLTRTLRDLNFKVFAYTNISNREMVNAIREFGGKLNTNTVALFYYSGHGVQVRGKNYLIPINANIEKEQDVEFEAVDAQRVIAEMENARSRMNIVILDACRDNPLARSMRGGSRGLATIDAPVGTYIAFSTAPGTVASDGEGRNGLYTQQLIMHLNTPGLRIEDVFKRVRAEVTTKSKGAQIPWENSSITGDFYFSGGISTVVTDASKRKTQKQSDKFSLDDIDREGEARRAEEKRIENEKKQKLQDMKDAFEKVQVVRKDPAIIYETKVAAKSRFLEFFANDSTNAEEYGRMRDLLSFGLNFLFVQGGTFRMGSEKAEDEMPVHWVTLSDFSISSTEATFDDYDKFCAATNRTKPSDNGWGRGKRPVINVSWNDAQAFCKWASEVMGMNVRLPTECEWEYAARGGSKARGYTYGGSDSLDDVGWSMSNSGNRTQEVARKRPNELGIYDMSGSLWEWCSDLYQKNFYAQSTSLNPHGPADGQNRVLRGGSWVNRPSYSRVTARNSALPDSKNEYFGFRVVLEK